MRFTYSALFFIVCLPLFGQINIDSVSRQLPLLKFGGFVYFEHSSYSGFSLHLSMERTFKRREYFTSGPRIDFVSLLRFPDKNLSVGYEIKFYPTYWNRRQAYRGIYIGIEPLVLIKSEANPMARYGPGVGSLLGYQHVIVDRFAIGLEGCMAYFKNLNKETRYVGSNPADRYFYFLLCLKLGVKI